MKVRWGIEKKKKTHGGISLSKMRNIEKDK